MREFLSDAEVPFEDRNIRRSNAAQAVLAAKAGASVVTIPVDQLDGLGQDSVSIVDSTRMLFDRTGVECDLVAAYRDASP